MVNVNGIDNALEIIVGKWFYFLETCSHHVLLEALSSRVSQAIFAYVEVRISSTISTILPIIVIDQALVSSYIAYIYIYIYIYICIHTHIYMYIYIYIYICV